MWSASYLGLTATIPVPSLCKNCTPVVLCRVVDVVREAAIKHNIVFLASAMNAGPALSTVQAPGGSSTGIIGVGAYA